MKKLVWIAEGGNFTISAVSNKLKDTGYELGGIFSNVNELGQQRDELDGILVFANEALLQKQDLMIYLKDRTAEDGTPVFVLWDDDGSGPAKAYLAESNIKLEFSRPIDVNTVAAKVDEYLKANDRSIKKKILVIDDSGAMLRSIKGWLEDKYQVILANSGAMGIKYMSQSLPDLILLDYEMPIIDGSQVLSMIRAEPDFAAVPVIFLTSKADKESIMKVLALKPEGYLLKTMAPSDIVKEIDGFFAKRQ